MNAIDQAREMYENAGKDFNEILIDHLQSGIVISSPMWFLMLRAEVWEEKTVWFVECAIGELRQLVRLVNLPLPFVAFCRVKNGKKQTKIYRTERLLRLVLA